MKKFLLIFFIVLSLACKSQTKNLWQKIPDDAKHVYSGVIITMVTGDLVYKYSKGRTGLAVGVGFLSGVTAGVAKELIWDKWMGKGVPSKWDAFSTAWGAGIGTISLRVMIDVRERKQYDEYSIEKLGKKKKRRHRNG